MFLAIRNNLARAVGLLVPTVYPQEKAPNGLGLESARWCALAARVIPITADASTRMAAADAKPGGGAPAALHPVNGLITMICFDRSCRWAFRRDNSALWVVP